MDSASAKGELTFVKDIMDKTSQRVDAHAFHFVHWGLIVLIWYPLGHWFGLQGQMDWYIGIGVASLVLGVTLSMWREIRLSRKSRLPGENTFIGRQVSRITFANVVAGAALSILAPATGVVDGPDVPIIWGLVYANMAFMMGVAFSTEFLISGIAIFCGTLVAILLPQFSGYILGAVMGLGMIIPGLRAESRVRQLVTSEPIPEAS